MTESDDPIGKDGLTLSQRLERVLPQDEALDRIVETLAGALMTAMKQPEYMAWKLSDGAVQYDECGTITIRLQRQQLLVKS